MILLALLLLVNTQEVREFTEKHNITGSIEVYGGYGTNYKAQRTEIREVEHTIYKPKLEQVARLINDAYATADDNYAGGLSRPFWHRKTGELKIEITRKSVRRKLKSLLGVKKAGDTGQVVSHNIKHGNIFWRDFELSDADVEEMERLFIGEEIVTTLEPVIIKKTKRGNWDFDHDITIRKTWYFDSPIGSK